jgi:hypothetical protein
MALYVPNTNTNIYFLQAGTPKNIIETLFVNKSSLLGKIAIFVLWVLVSVLRIRMDPH